MLRLGYGRGRAPGCSPRTADQPAQVHWAKVLAMELSVNTTSRPPIVSRAEWQLARARLLEKEKAATRVQDALAAERRRLPMVRIDKPYLFEGEGGKASLADLFAGRRQLILYHFMF